MTGKNKHLKWIKIMFAILLILILCFGISLGVLVYAEKHVQAANPQEAQAIIVLGAQVKADGDLSRQLTSRMESALSLWKEHPCVIVVCGAQGSNEPLPEAEAMAAWLIEHGVPDEDILQDCSSFNTRQNLLNASALLNGTAERVIVVTSDYHLPRALSIAKDVGLSAAGVGSPTLPEYWIKNHFREVLAWGKYLVQKWFGI